MIWKRETPARVTEALVAEHENRRIGKVLEGHLRKFAGTARDVRAVTGQDPVAEADE